jgi:hypothetical protein
MCPIPYAVLEQAFSAARQAVVLKRNYFSDRPIIRVHEIAARRGFVLFARTPDFDGVTIPDEGAYGAQLVFLRI